ncbi:DUF4411 family protein [Bradyrhizobium sp. LTSPM299]|uniref:DUF4411 family protein n=1 Tax=Bradyrhizobium sp. LTSPM299 TaxID=1619233 RepID=UPI000AD599B7|nr:DUF4411 family protein [Bradyrhizobium sp. LTSPM299]
MSSTLVLRECSKKRSEELHDWLQPRSAMFHTPDETVQGQVDHIVNTYTALVSAGKEKFQADPFVIAQAKVSGYAVITEETGVGSLGKIPGVCNAMKVECINLMQLIDAEDWVLG